MADNENTFIIRDDLNKFGKLDYHDVINDNRRSNARANAWGEQNANAPAQVNALKGTYQTAFAEHMTKTDGFMRNKVGRGDSDLMTNIKIALNEVNHKLCTPLEQEKAENKTGNFIYDLNDTHGVLNEHAKNKAAASRLFSVLGISNLCTNSRITAVKDANGKLTFGTKSEKLHSQTFESGSNVALYSELKEKIKNDADGTNGDIRFSAEAMSDLSTIKLMNALMGGMGYRHRRERYSYRDGTVFFYLSNSEQ